MKLLKVVICLLFLAISVAPSARVQLYANCWLNGGVSAACETCNYNYNVPIRCQMSIRGLSYRGFWFTSNQSQILYPGQCMNGHVYANNPYYDSLVDASASTYCSF